VHIEPLDMSDPSQPGHFLGGSLLPAAMPSVPPVSPTDPRLPDGSVLDSGFTCIMRGKMDRKILEARGREHLLSLNNI